MKKTVLVRLFALVGLASLFTVGLAQAPLNAKTEKALDAFLDNNPSANASIRDGRITRLFGNVKEGALSPAQAASQFVRRNATLFGVAPNDLVLYRDITVENGKFTAVQFRQTHGGVPVFGGGLAVLVRPGVLHQIVLVVPSTKPVPSAAPTRTISADRALEIALAQVPDARSATEPEYVVWSDGFASAYAWMVIVDNENLQNPVRNRYFVDAVSGRILETKSEIYYFDDFIINVQGFRTPGTAPDTPSNPPVIGPMPGLEVLVPPTGGRFTDASGNVSFPIDGRLIVSARAHLRGRWAKAVDVEGRDEVLFASQQASLPFSLIFNQSQQAHITAQVNAFLHTEIVHNFAKAINPAYPGIDIQMPANVNIDSACNAFYNGSSINFFRANGGCVNTAYSSVVYHEYGHHIVASGHLNPTGDFHEGVADITSMLLLDDPIIGRDFSGPGNHVRNCSTSNEQYPCNGGSHQCGQVICGAFWDTLVGLKAKWGNNPALDLARYLYLNLILMSPPAIDPDITIDVLTLDDDDGDIMNGTPNYAEINEGFTAHNLPAPPVPDITQFTFTPVEFVGGFSPTVRVTLNSIAGGGGEVVTFTNSHPGVINMPANVTVPAGSSTVTFTVSSNPVSSATMVTLTATHGVFTRELIVVVHPITIRSVTLDPNNVVGGTSSTGTVVFDPPIPDSGATINLSSSNPAVASVPATIKVPGGATSANFTVTTTPTSSTQNARITASFGTSSAFADLTVQTPSLFSFVVNPRTVQGGNSTTGTVTLNGPAPAGGAVVTLVSLNPSVVQVPSTVTVPAGATTANFTINTSPVTSTKQVTVRASRYAIKSQAITVTP